MNARLFPVMLASMLLAAPVAAQDLEVTRSGQAPSRLGPTETFTGHVVIAPLFSAQPSTRASGMTVTFAPGARTFWHSHPAGQTLVVTHGRGAVQNWGGAKRDIRPGDVVWIPPGVKHWHGGTPTTGMTHIAVLEPVGDKVVDWMEPVTDAQYSVNPL